MLLCETRLSLGTNWRWRSETAMTSSFASHGQEKARVTTTTVLLGEREA